MSDQRPSPPLRLLTDVVRLQQETLALVCASRERLALSKSSLVQPIHRPIVPVPTGDRAPFTA